MALTIGIDVGGTNLRIGVFSGLQCIDEIRFQADFSHLCNNNPPSEAWQKILKVTANAIQTVLQKHPDVETIGIGFPGFINPQTQTIAQSPNLPGLKNVNLSADLSQMTGKKAKIKRIVVENDANAAAYERCKCLGANTGQHCQAYRYKKCGDWWWFNGRLVTHANAIQSALAGRFGTRITR